MTDPTPIHGRVGETIAWLDDGVVYDMCGRWVAFLDDDIVYSFRGQPLGHFEDGWFRELRGDAVAFVEGCADNGPVIPVCETVPIPPALDCPPMPPTPHEFPVSGIPGVDWSLGTWGEFISGATAASLY